MTLAKTAYDLTKFAFEFAGQEGLTVSATYRRLKGAIGAGDRLALDPQPTLHSVQLIDDSPAHSLERTTQGDMRTTEERPEKTFLVDWHQMQTHGFVPAEGDELDVTEKEGVVRYRIDQIVADPIKAHYQMGSRRTGA